MRRDRASRPWHLYLLGLLAVVVAVLAVVEIGPPSSSARTSREIVTAQDGVVQSTVTGTGNVAAGTDENVNFKTSGTLETVYVSTGRHVHRGQLLAQLDPASAQLSLDQAEASLTSAEYQLTAAENGTSSGSGSSGSGSGSTGASYTGAQGSTELVSETTTTSTGTKKPTGTRKPTATRTTTITRTTTTTRAPTTPTTPTTTPSPAAIASAQAAVYGAQASVANAEQTLADTKLYAPVSGTIASMADLVPGDSVTGGSTSNAASSGSSSSSSSGTGGGVGGGTSTAGSLGSSSSASSSSGSGSSSPFVQIVNTSSLSMTVSFSESDITKIKVGQPATVTLDALSGVELAAHVSQISDVGTTSSGVVSYDATITLDQTDAQVKPGMSASAAVITGQAQGVNVPNSAVAGSGSVGTVNVMKGGKTVQQEVVVGLRGDSRTEIISGVSAGQQLVVTVALPALSSSTTSTSGSGTLGGGGGRFGLGGGGLGGGGLGGGAGAFFRGGGG